MAVAMGGFVLGDSFVKAASHHLGMGQIILVRGLIASVLIAALTLQRGAMRPLRSVLQPMVGLRVVGEIGATFFYILALAQIPLANVSAIQQALPLAVTMGAALFLGESVGWRRWLAIGVGFLGVMVIVRPGMEGFSIYSVSVLVCVLFCTVRDLSTSRIPAELPPLFLSTVTAVLVTVFGAAIIVPVGGWKPLDWYLLSLLAAAAVTLLVGYQFLIRAMREGDISFAAPFRYTALLWAMVLGVLVFGELPDMATVVGAAIIIASGIYALYRERLRGRGRPAAESVSPSMNPDGI